MADRFENELLPQNYEDMDIANDFVRVVDKNGVSYTDKISDLSRLIVEEYAGSVLAGTPQPLQTAIDLLNGRIDTNAQSITDRTATAEELQTVAEILGIGGE